MRLSKRNPIKAKVTAINHTIKVEVLLTKGILKDIIDIASDYGHSIPDMIGTMLIEYIDDVNLRAKGYDGLLTALHPPSTKELD